MIIGGAEIHAACLPRATTIHLTEVHEDFTGDAAMAPFDRETWMETDREEHNTAEGIAFSFVTLTRREETRR